jgi:hypothetical protein
MTMVKSGDGTRKPRLSLEDAFFLKKDNKLLEKMRELKRMEETKKAISEASGIHNEDVLHKLLDLNVRPEMVAALSIVPLVEVAWADGDLDEKEIDAVIRGAEAAGIAKGTPSFALLLRWLERKPGPEMLEAWTYYINGVCEKLEAKEREELKRELLGRARTVAEAAGGFLRLTSRISRKEKEMLGKLEDAFGK